jgi:hypothetical protein
VYFTNKFNDKTNEPTLTIEAVYGIPSVNFMDTIITPLPSATWNFKTYRKPTRKNSYLLFSSDHPTHVKTGLIKTELNRFRQNSTNDADYEIEKEKLRTDLQARQYPPHFVQSIFESFQPHRETLLYPERRPPTTDRKNDRTTDGTTDRTELYNFFPTDAASGWENYTQTQGLASSSGS